LLNVEASSDDFLKVITPLADIYAFKSNNLKANSCEPVKQCIKILKSFSIFLLFNISNVSFSADLVCTIKGIFKV